VYISLLCRLRRDEFVVLFNRMNIMIGDVHFGNNNNENGPDATEPTKSERKTRPGKRQPGVE
jgi:hypothetical protein